jgi:hypothetical protein
MRLTDLVCIHQHREVEMSIRRLVLSAAGMAAIAALLSALSPALPVMTGALAHAQRTVDTAGPDALVLAAAGLLAWAVWLWGAIGLGLTALTAAPGVLGAASSVVVRLVLPAATRRAAAVLLGLGLGVTPLVGTVSVLVPTTASAAGPATADAFVADWPSPASPAPAAAVPDWPSTPPGPGTPFMPGASPSGRSDPHVVRRGECLWHIAADGLARGRAATPTDGEIASAVQAWWTTNASVIGPDPGRLLPGQVLVPPAGP